MQYCVQFNCHACSPWKQNNDYSVPWIKHASCLFVFKLAATNCINLKALTVSTVVNDTQKQELLDI